MKRTETRVSATGWLRSAMVLLVLMLFAAPASAQFRLLIGQPLFDDYPTIKIPVEILDNTATLDSVTADNFMLWENGVQKAPLRIDCGDMQAAQKIHFFFIMDVSYSMAFIEGTNRYDRDSVKWRAAKQVFIESFDRLRPQDEGALASFAYDFNYEQPFTSDKDLLKDAAAGMRLRAGTAIYNAIVTASGYAAQKEGKKVIILLTDGVDNRSNYLREEAIDIAWSRGVPVYPIGLGFYPDLNNPNRVDQDTLRRIAQGTGGKAFFAPTSEDLADIFDDIMESIYTIGCILRYDTQDTCRDGSSRTIDIRADVKGLILEEQFTYTLPDLRSRLALTLDMPTDPLMAGDTYEIPVRINGELRPGQELSGEVVLTYDPDMVDVLGIRNGSDVLDPADIAIAEPTPGELHFTLNNAMPLRAVSYSNADVLFTIEVLVQQRKSIAASSFLLSVPWASQICEIMPSALGSPFNIHGCPSSIEVGFDTSVVALPGALMEIPILMPSDLDFSQSLEYDLWLDYDPEIFSYQEFLVEGSISEGLTVDVTPIGDALHITAGPGIPVDAGPVLLTLRFRAAELKVATSFAFRLRDLILTQTAIAFQASVCRPQVDLFGDGLYAEGTCQPLVRRKPGPALEQSSPNPLTAGNSAATIGFTTTGTHPVHLSVIDEYGRTHAVLADELLSAGRHTVQWHPDTAPSGIYLCILREGDEIRTKKILITR